MKAAFYIRYALRSLMRGGQRTFLSLLCIAFGVMSLVALQTVAGMVHQALAPDPRVQLGGDASLSLPVRPASAKSDSARPPREVLMAARISELDRLRAEGVISAYSLEARGQAVAIRPESSTRSVLISRAMGVDPGTYPLVGQVAVAGQSDGRAALAEALARPGMAAVSYDLAASLNLHPGSRITLIGGGGEQPRLLQVAAIVDAVPDRRGQTVLFSLDTARQLTGLPDVVDTVAVTWGPQGNAAGPLTAAGWDVFDTATLGNDRTVDNVTIVFTFMLRAAGILGLIIGGIGVANTLQVLLARRTLEIAVLKTHGFRQEHLLALFGVETVLLGLSGSALGALAALAVSGPLVRLIQAFVGDAGVWSVAPGLVAGGLLAGTATAVIFGLNAVVRASSVRPAVLLREMPVAYRWKVHLAGARLYGVLAAAFVALASLIMESLPLGIAVVAGAALGLVVLGAVFGGILVLIARLPLPGRSMLGLARSNLRRQSLRSIFALIALFAGVFSVGFGIAAVQAARDRAAERQVPVQGANIWVYATAADGPQVSAALRAQGAQDVRVSLQTPVEVSRVGAAVAARLEGHTAADAGMDFRLVDGASWSSSPEAAYLAQNFQFAPWSLAAGSPLTITMPSGGLHVFRVAGFYQPGQNTLLAGQGSVLVNEDAMQQLPGVTPMATYSGQLPLVRLQAATDALGAALPGMTIISGGDVLNLLQRFFVNLVTFVVAVAGLAMLAGAVLIANAVSLAVVERRREIGILKAVGFTSGQVLQAILLENGMIGLIGGLCGMIAVTIAVPILNALLPALRMGLYPLLVALLVGAAVLFALGSAALVAWEPAHVRPLEVLRDE